MATTSPLASADATAVPVSPVSVRAGGLRRASSLTIAGVAFAVQVILALSIVPPWQNPDEPQHVMTARLVAAHGAEFTLDVDLDPESERAILNSMAQHRWWVHYGVPTPDPVPATFAEGPARVVTGYFGPPGGGSRLYYRIVASLFGSNTDGGLVAELYGMRLLASAAGFGVLVLTWYATRIWLDDLSAAVVTALMALHPQFILVSTTASPDAAVNLAAAAFWCALVSLVAAARAERHLGAAWAAGVMIAAALIGAIIRRMGAALIVLAIGMIALYLGRLAFGRKQQRRAQMLAAGFVVGSIAVIAAVGAWLVPDDIAMAREWVEFDIARAMRAIGGRADELPGFLAGLFQSFWLSAGWLRYNAAAPWYAAAGALMLASATGMALRRTGVGYPDILVAAVALIGVQTTAIVAYHFGVLGAGAQGRYLFPALPAVLSLIWVGWRAWFPRDARTAAAVALVAVVAVLNVTAWTLTILPAYLDDAVQAGSRP